MGERDKPDALRGDLRTDWHRYVDALVPLRRSTGTAGASPEPCERPRISRRTPSSAPSLDGA